MKELDVTEDKAQTEAEHKAWHKAQGKKAQRATCKTRTQAGGVLNA